MKFAASLAVLVSYIAIWSSPVRAAAIRSPDEVCYDSCQACLKPVHFDETLWNQTGLLKPCYSPRAIISLYLCLEVYCKPGARTVGLGPLNETCQERAHTVLPPFSLISNYTVEDIAKVRRFELNETGQSHTFREVVIPSEHFFRVWWDTLDAVAYVYWYHFIYGAAMVVFWVVVVAIGIMNHVGQHIAALRMVRSKSSGSGSKLSNFYTRTLGSITTPATFGDRCAQKIGWGTVPPRIQSLTLVAFLLVNIALSIHGYRITPENFYFETKKRQILRYASDRTGIISFANFPLIWLFGMRNNILMWLTGWDFGTYNNFHRWVARIATVQAIIHSIGYTLLVIDEGGMEAFINWWSYTFWWTGEVATIFMSLLIGASFYWIRRQHYELFLVVHIVMSIIVLITMLGHVSIFGGQFDGLFWVPCFIWVGDRVLRALRIAAFNPKFWDTRATSIYNPSSNIVRLVIPWSTSLYKPAPGTYYYIHVLNGPRCWESHPFTVATVSDEGQPAAKLLGEQVPLLEADNVGTSSDSAETQSLYPETCNMTFLIRPYDGFTSRLRDTAEAAWPRKVPQTVLVDGPYGHTQPFHLFDNVVFVVGGSGIVVPLSYLQALTGPIAPKSVKIHWAVREPGFALDVLHNDIGELLGSSNLSIEIHLTAHTPRDELNDWPSQVTLHHGRINAASVVRGASEKAGSESVAVVACGPAQMADTARKTVVEMLHNGVSRIEYFEESFQW
ncbi:FAD-binding FR-type domain-containing protein [Fusarium keratoplasticum]|uniref:FAD-binding FR-type domain-containing protein n=1 Tax=Fusarium keratoplasticum TaxID=1328300 RepID=A0ACC0R5F4_9HYPO|nr:FAD-binding FR-type domain-containing protein [Fusarium keratoplasticum]KAI8674461.1 FAD-binding FR-type domain-containing protein [Fusarium keratoplasticum]KAI8680980.1 FAD-binding FR-type domain-containing protein [Fusarium keratoplasticum]